MMSVAVARLPYYANDVGEQRPATVINICCELLKAAINYSPCKSTVTGVKMRLTFH